MSENDKTPKSFGMLMLELRLQQIRGLPTREEQMSQLSLLWFGFITVTAVLCDDKGTRDAAHLIMEKSQELVKQWEADDKIFGRTAARG